MKVLIVDSDIKTKDVILQAFATPELLCRHTSSASEAITLAPVFNPDLIILEVDLDDSNGIELCSGIREALPPERVIIFYSSKQEEFIQVAALDAGANDYIIKPKKPYFLRSKLAALTRRNQKLNVSIGIVLNSESRTVLKNGRSIYLSKKEFEIFQLLYSRPNHIFNREQILSELWNSLEERSRMLDVHISHIREKLGDNVIKTVKGIGYGYIHKAL